MTRYNTKKKTKKKKRKIMLPPIYSIHSVHKYETFKARKHSVATERKAVSA